MSTTATDPKSGFETTFITRSELSDEALKALQDRLAAAITEYKGEIVLTEDWGRRKLAYPIQKETRGHYNYVVYTGTGDVVHEIERHLRLHDHVLRFLTVNLDKEFDAEAFRKQRAEVHAAAKRREEEREARREERMAERRGYEDAGERRHEKPEFVEESASEIVEE
ncbi:MAG: 30S ribosomal protein S6 [Bdellovibrionales bacterium RIFOXYC1_FULL_54_43]|nr:MAG: 30S ribosomal protein S6 [Bdellovibrionales bacterium RIFOXYC1_FULL_54_43]OFZ83494.1 MAG: 30S ribosomal protein S6 [Bdellovibrionales bacterium RIFOXYD1_FULL_55_31]